MLIVGVILVVVTYEVVGGCRVLEYLFGDSYRGIIFCGFTFGVLDYTSTDSLDSCIGIRN